MQAGHAEVGFEPRPHPACLDDHARLIGHGHIRSAGCEDADLAVERFRGKPRSQHSSRVRVVDDFHVRFARSLVERSAMLGGHAADEPLALALGQRHRQPRCLGGGFAGRQHHLGDPAPHEAAEVEPRPPAELFELKASQLGQGFVLRQLARRQPAQDVSQRPASTSRMRCQCVPAQYMRPHTGHSE